MCPPYLWVLTPMHLERPVRFAGQNIKIKFGKEFHPDKTNGLEDVVQGQKHDEEGVNRQAQH